MIAINDKTLKDLEFQTILVTIAEKCNTELGYEKTLAIQLIKEKRQLFFRISLYK